MVERVNQRRGINRRGKQTSATPSISDAKVDVVLQRIEEPIGSEIEVIPSHVRRYGVNNIFIRTLTYLFGWQSNNIPVKLRATAAGVLKVADVGSGLEDSDVKKGLATDALTAQTKFDKVASLVDIKVWDYSLDVALSKDGVTYNDTEEIPANSVFSIAQVCHTLKVGNHTDGLDARYEIVGRW